MRARNQDERAARNAGAASRDAAAGLRRVKSGVTRATRHDIYEEKDIYEEQDIYGEHDIYGERAGRRGPGSAMRRGPRRASSVIYDEKGHL